MPVCALCRREVGEITTHHLMPYPRHKHRKNTKDFTRDGVKGRPVDLCRSCHTWVHMLTNKEAQHYF
jgi:hypothetical protein